MKKLLSLFIAFVFLAGISDVALAADATTVDNGTVSTGSTTPVKPAVKKSKTKANKNTKSKKKTSTKSKTKKKKKTSAYTTKPAGN